MIVYTITVFNHLTTTIDVNYVLSYSPYRTVNTLRLGYKTSELMLYREIIAVCSEIHIKHITQITFKYPVRTVQ